MRIEKIETPKISEVFAQCSVKFIGPARTKQDTQFGDGDRKRNVVDYERLIRRHER